MFSIGEFSKITGLTVKTLRFYHERDVLVPARVEAATGYRSYDTHNVETARTITALRECGFSLEVIAAILTEHADDADLLTFLERRKQALAERMARDRDVVSVIDQIIHREREARTMLQQQSFPVEEKTLPPMLVAGIRMQGRYEQCGQAFAKLGRALGRCISGKPLCLYFDGEYREENANFEPCLPVRQPVDTEGIDVREIPGGRCISLVHRGPYNELGRAYGRLLQYAKERGYSMQVPTREVYVKGPGMFFKGNPKKYLTEIQILIEESGHAP
ncbi:MAG: MerR family transcriptional regulator [Planctomycetaceae bacterium]